MPGWNAHSSGNPLTTGQPQGANRGASYKVHEVQQRVDAVKGIMCATHDARVVQCGTLHAICS